VCVIVEFIVGHHISKKVYSQDWKNKIDQDKDHSNIKHCWKAKHEGHHRIFKGSIAFKEEENSYNPEWSNDSCLRTDRWITTWVQHDAEYSYKYDDQIENVPIVFEKSIAIANCFDQELDCKNDGENNIYVVEILYNDFWLSVPLQWEDNCVHNNA
jgi:hypothetical protein